MNSCGSDPQLISYRFKLTPGWAASTTEGSCWDGHLYPEIPGFFGFDLAILSSFFVWIFLWGWWVNLRNPLPSVKWQVKSFQFKDVFSIETWNFARRAVDYQSVYDKHTWYPKESLGFNGMGSQNEIVWRSHDSLWVARGQKFYITNLLVSNDS